MAFSSQFDLTAAKNSRLVNPMTLRTLLTNHLWCRSFQTQLSSSFYLKNHSSCRGKRGKYKLKSQRVFPVSPERCHDIFCSSRSVGCESLPMRSNVFLSRKRILQRSLPSPQYRCDCCHLLTYHKCLRQSGKYSVNEHFHLEFFTELSARYSKA